MSERNGHGESPDRLANATLAVHAGRDPRPGEALTQAPVHASVFRAGGERSYAREGNPTWAAFEGAVAALEGAADAVAFPSGLAAAGAFLGTLPKGARVLVARTAHVELRRLLAELSADDRLEVEIGDPGDPSPFAAAVASADLVWVDSIANPTLEVAPIEAIATVAERNGTVLAVDATLATPILQRPLALGADVVLHSASKYLGGHSDLLLGVIATKDPSVADILRKRREGGGATPGTTESWLALRGIRTLELRVERGQASAALLARRLDSHPEVVDVRYPRPEDAGDHGSLDGRGAMISFTVAGGAGRADAVCAAVRLVIHAGSLGGVESLIERHARWHSEPGIPPGLLRLSVGCEDPGDLWRDLDRALRVTSSRRKPFNPRRVPTRAV
jgi:cystathionine gamma-synthase